ncbi:hypothetical protein R3P38DRAFT_2530769 [Favolaschia claudopus]|uniref:HTH Mu-type domain-containing protein n=1 Tax=Favolaschia claudopus TaxID=2862362 RepID=A0AAW0BHH8_9AGAR
MSSLPDRIRTAINLQLAIENAATYLSPIGKCSSKAIKAWRKTNPGEEEWAWGHEGSDHDDDDEDYYGRGNDNSSDFSTDEDVETEIMDNLRAMQSNYKTVASGKLADLSFHLTITRTGCELDGELSGLESKKGLETNRRLRRWYDAGDVSGYGDVKSQQTKIDSAVRHAREIPAKDFGVSNEFINEVETIWAQSSFFPTHVRAEPYKIHLYGPGGKFIAHRDTPETDLVGTFLVGLGDTAKTRENNENGAFVVNDHSNFTYHTANLGSWIAFYPDVEHAVQEIANGYRAVIAFKIFRIHREPPELPVDSAMHHKMKNLLAQVEKPYGILLKHSYSAGTLDLSGFDAALCAAAREDGGDVKVLPVVIRWKREGSGYPGSGQANVYPLTDTHVNAVLAHVQTTTKEQRRPDKTSYYVHNHQKPKVYIDLRGTDAEWIHSYGSTWIPFFSPNFEESMISLKETKRDGNSHAGNEARPYRADSIYLSYAVVVLPVTRGAKRTASSSGIGDSNSEEEYTENDNVDS